MSAVTSPLTTDTARAVLLFDGECNFCNDSVRFVVERDGAARFQFASLQSEAGKRLLTRFGIGFDVNTMVLIDGETAFTRSDAALHVMQHLGTGYRWLGNIGLLFPRFLRNWAYSLFARHRYTLFGKTDQCLVPTRELRQRFLVD
jgi:predicted DCC family thiol-disulfide oxidoreductase YuxK